MALSGTILGSYAGGTTYKPYLRWSVTQDVEANKSTLSVTFGMYKAKTNSETYDTNAKTLTLTIDGTVYTRSVTFDFRTKAVGTYNDIVTISGIAITHNSDGSRSVAMSASHPTGTSLSTGTVSGTAEITDISRATTPVLSPSSLNIGETLTVSLSPASSAFTHTILYSFGSQSGTIATGVKTSASWVLPDSLVSAIPNATSGLGTIICETYSGSTLIGSKTATFTAVVPDSGFNPIISSSNISISDLYSDITTKFSGYVQNKSQLLITIDEDAIANANTSTIVKYETTVSGQTYVGTDIMTDAISQSGTLAVVTTITDSRGRSSSVTKNITVYPYSNPIITAYNAFRSDSSGAADEKGEYISVYMGYEIASVNNKNDRNYTLSYKKTADSTYTTVVSGTAQTSYEGVYVITNTTFSIDYQWEIQLEVSDYFTSGEPIARIASVETEEVILDFNKSGKGVGVGKVSEIDGFEVAWDASFSESFRLRGLKLADYLYPVGAIYISTSPMNPSELFGGEWQLISGRFLLAASDEYPAGSTGGEAEVTLTEDQMPSHKHEYRFTGQSSSEGTDAVRLYTSPTEQLNAYTGDGESAGGDQAHNNMPPYLSVYVWERTALDDNIVRTITTESGDTMITENGNTIIA